MKKKNLLVVLINILLIGLFAKGLSFISKIIMTRSFGLEAISIFSIVNPMLVLILTLSNLSLPTVIATLISKNKSKCTSIIISSFSICIILSLSLMIIVHFSTPFISSSLLHNEKVIPSLNAFILLIPLTSISSIIKGYFLGIGEIKLTSIAQVFEESGRLLFILIAIYLFSNQSDEFKASLCVYSLCLGEIFQMGAHIIFSSNKIYKKTRNILQEFTKKENYHLQEIISFSLPLTTARLIGSLTYFFEPIILMAILLRKGQDTTSITLEYGLLSSFIMPLLLMPGFLSTTLSNYLLPKMGNLIGKNQYLKAKNLFIKILTISLVLGIFISLLFFLFPSFILNVVYSINEGSSYLRTLAFPFVIFYLESIILAAMNALGLSKEAFISTFTSSILRIVALVIFVNKIGTFGVALATLVSVYTDVIMNLFFVLRCFRNYEKRILQIQC
ncbi:MAG: oligosaccharide flippase family protein [Bacilli bacterium]